MWKNHVSVLDKIWWSRQDIRGPVGECPFILSNSNSSNWSDHIAARLSSWLNRCLSCTTFGILERMWSSVYNDVSMYIWSMIWYDWFIMCREYEYGCIAYTDIQWGPQVTDPPLAFIWLAWSRRNNPPALAIPLPDIKWRSFPKLSSGWVDKADDHDKWGCQ